MIEEVPKGHNIRQMFWAGIWGRGRRSKLVAMIRDEEAEQRGYTRRSYIWALEEGLLDIYEPGQIFMQDNAPIHHAHDIHDWFKRHGVWVIQLPLYSPDLNPIEHIWWALKRKVFELYPELKGQGSSNKAYDNLISACEEAWDLIREDIIDTCLGSMRKRCEAVIAADG